MGKVKARISNRDLSTVRIFDNCDDEEKNNLIARSDLMVAPALYGESFGIVLLEAMALGVKVVGFGNEG
jgi:phosphatidylinositol alpha-mannosyltransferase